jgi:hypothetical protein
MTERGDDIHTKQGSLDNELPSFSMIMFLLYRNFKFRRATDIKHSTRDPSFSAVQRRKQPPGERENLLLFSGRIKVSALDFNYAIRFKMIPFKRHRSVSDYSLFTPSFSVHDSD